MSSIKFLKEKSRIWQFVFILIWCAQMLTAVYFCYQKQGFHEDEYYTYYSTARTYGLNIEDNSWMEHDAYFNEFVVLEEERFQYGLVKQVQSWDVHPPVYYWLFHTIASLFPGKFSKWFGLILNLAAYGVSMVLLWLLCLKVTQNNEKLSLLVCLFYGFTPAVMSSVVFIRMYALLTMFVLLCAVLHVSAVIAYSNESVMESGAGSSDNPPYKTNGYVELSLWKFLIPIAVVTYFGFLTQYYYFIFLFFMAAAFCVYLLWKDRNVWNCLRYGVSLAAAFVLAYLTYPSCLGQMFRGQRGAQATGNFFDVSNTVMRLKFFYQLMDEYVFGKMLTVLLIVIVMLIGLRIVKKRESRSSNSEIEHSACFILLFTIIGYFFVVSKTALLLGETSIRYQIPIYGIAVLLIFEAINVMGKRCLLYIVPTSKFRYNIMIAAAVVVTLIVNISGLLAGRVVFLYPEDEGRIAFAREQASNNTLAVYIYDENQSWCVWDAADELFEYDRIYFAGQGSTDAIMDSDILAGKELIVYLNSTADTQNQLNRIIESNPNLSDYELQYKEKYCDVYYLYGED